MSQLAPITTLDPRARRRPSDIRGRVRSGRDADTRRRVRARGGGMALPADIDDVVADIEIRGGRSAPATAATQDALPPQSKPPRIGRSRPRASASWTMSRPRATCCPLRMTALDIKRVGPNPRANGAMTRRLRAPGSRPPHRRRARRKGNRATESLASRREGRARHRRPAGRPSRRSTRPCLERSPTDEYPMRKKLQAFEGPLLSSMGYGATRRPFSNDLIHARSCTRPFKHRSAETFD